ncbi:MAG: PIN domain-containing protein [Bryobacteraceae bacterium]
MNGREFVDTNILVYAFDRDAGEKNRRAVALLERLWNERSGCLSLQVLQEFYVTVTRKLNLPALEAIKQVGRFGKWVVHRPNLEDVLAAMELSRRKQISFWDALMLRSALALECSVVWSEDLGHGQRWGSLTVRNPLGDETS